jgi:hypothetical protein
MKSGVGWYNAPKELLTEAWSPSNPSHTQFAINASNQNNLQISDWLVENGSYLRIKSVLLGYTLPETLINKIGIKSLRFFASGFNLFAVTKLKVFDPEGSSESGQFYPQQRIINIGANVRF